MKRLLFSVVSVFSILSTAHSQNSTIVEKLSNNKNFVFVIEESMDFAKKIVENQAVALYKKYANKTATTAESNLLFNKLGYENESQMLNDLKPIALARNQVFEDLPELKKQTHKSIFRQGLENYFSRANETVFLKKIVLPDCYYIYFAMIDACWAIYWLNPNYLNEDDNLSWVTICLTTANIWLVASGCLTES